MDEIWCMLCAVRVVAAAPTDQDWWIIIRGDCACVAPCGAAVPTWAVVVLHWKPCGPKALGQKNPEARYNVLPDFLFICTYG